MDNRETAEPQDTDSTLSPSGQVRREAMLGDLVAHMHQRRARRRTARTAAVLLLVGTVSVWFVIRPQTKRLATIPSVSPPSHQAPVATNTRPLKASSTVIRTVIVKTDPASDQRLGFQSGQPVAAQTIGDDQLMDALIEAGRPSGFVRIGARVTIVDSAGDDWSDPRPKTQGQLDSTPASSIRSDRTAV